MFRGKKYTNKAKIEHLKCNHAIQTLAPIKMISISFKIYIRNTEQT